MSWLRKDQTEAIRIVAAREGWDRLPTDSVRLLMWSAFHYYVMRLHDDESLAQGGGLATAAGKE